MGGGARRGLARGQHSGVRPAATTRPVILLPRGTGRIRTAARGTGPGRGRARRDAGAGAKAVADPGASAPRCPSLTGGGRGAPPGHRRTRGCCPPGGGWGPHAPHRHHTHARAHESHQGRAGGGGSRRDRRRLTPARPRPRDPHGRRPAGLRGGRGRVSAPLWPTPAPRGAATSSDDSQTCTGRGGGPGPHGETRVQGHRRTGSVRMMVRGA